jgi:metallo-beta-lactamase class B
MKTTPGFALAVFGCVISFAARAADSGISVRHLVGPIYLVEDEHYTKTNSLIYIGPSHVTVVGASWTPETAKTLRDQIRRLTSRPVQEVIDTSPDPEWSGGNGYWKSIGAKIIAVQVTADVLKRTWTTTVDQCRKNHPDYPQLPLVPPTETHAGEFELQHGHIRAFYLGPSHTAGDIFVYFPSEKLLDAGSILKEQLGNMAKADVNEYPNTLRKLKALHLDVETVISGHWSPIHGPDLVDRYLDLLAAYQPAK